MKRIIYPLLFLVVTQAWSQGEIPVNMYTGTPTIEIPLWTLTDHDISIPVALSYSASGVRLEQSDGRYGLGWNLMSDYAVRRQLRGLPDDHMGSDSDPRRGWLSQNVAAGIAAVSDNADLSSSTCSDEQADQGTIHSFAYNIDTEPDVFTISLPGFSGSFVFDNASTPQIRLMPYAADVDITYNTVSETDKSIASFTVRTNNGFKYVFGRTISVVRKTVKNAAINSITFLSREYNQYSTPVRYVSEWRLTRVESPSGAYVDFSYSPFDSPVGEIEIPVNLGIYGKKQVVTAYTIEEISIDYWLDYIAGSAGQKVEFKKNSPETLDKVIIYDARKRGDNKLVKEYFLDYINLWERKFLKKVTEISGCDKTPPFVFDYIGQDERFGLPAAISGIRKDFWGYYNGQGIDSEIRIPTIYIYPNEMPAERFRLNPIPGYTGTEVIIPGAYRSPNEALIKFGTLNKITYPTGGSAVIQYEANTYYDHRTGLEYKGGGLRIKSITQFDGLNNPGHLTKVFDYTDPATGKSSGTLISRPMFIMPAWKYRDPNMLNDASRDQSYAVLANTKTVEELWKYFTIRTEHDLSPQSTTHGSPVAYRYVTVKRPGAGSARHEFFMPGTYGASATGLWSATQNKFARPITCPSTGIVTSGGIWWYPFAPNADIDHERGLLWKKSEFNEAGALVRYTENEYQNIFKTGTQPASVSGLYYDRYANSDEAIYFYGKYALLTDYHRVLSKETVTTYDEANSTKKLTQSVQYFYESPYHRLLTKVVKTTSDGVLYTTTFKYPHDYGAIPSNSSAELLRIKDLQDPAIFRHGAVIEAIDKVLPVGGSEQVTGATLITFSDFGQPGKILPYQTMSLNVAAPIGNFVHSYAHLQGSTYVLKADDHYQVVSTFTDFDAYDKPIAVTGMNRKTSCTVWGYNKTAPVAMVSGAAPSEFAFSDFETASANEFQLADAYFAAPRTGINGLHPYATLSKTVSKGLSHNFILSFWLKSSGAVSFRVTVKSTDLVTTYYDNTFSITPSPSTFDFVQKIIPVSAAPASFVVELSGQGLAQPSGSSSVLEPSMDDVAFYPEQASLTSYTYTFPYGASSVTDNKLGKTLFTVYDGLGRMQHASDQDKNILSRNSYTYSQPLFLLSADFSIPEVIYTNEAFTITAAGNSCISEVNYEWDLGTGVFVPGSSELSHTYTTSKTYIIYLRVSHPTLGRAVSYKKVTVAPRPIFVNVCAQGALAYRNRDGVYHGSTCGIFSTPLPQDKTLFYAEVHENIPGLTYVWKKRCAGMPAGPNCSDSWTTVAEGSNQFLLTEVHPLEQNLEIKCEVSADGRTGSHTIPIQVYSVDE